MKVNIQTDENADIKVDKLMDKNFDVKVDKQMDKKKQKNYIPSYGLGIKKSRNTAIDSGYNY